MRLSDLRSVVDCLKHSLNMKKPVIIEYDSEIKDQEFVKTAVSLINQQIREDQRLTVRMGILKGDDPLPWKSDPNLKKIGLFKRPVGA
jgi:hypothetical protein